jgi:hypothetical protein
MRHISYVLAIGLLTAAIACGSTMRLPPVQPEDVDVFMPGSYPSEDYEVMTRFNVRVGLQEPDQTLVDRARARAAEIGADAVVVTAIRRTSEGGVDMDLSQEQQKILEALAVYYPSRHPELDN